MLREFGMIGVRRGSEAREDDGNPASDGLASIQGGFGGYEESL